MVTAETRPFLGFTLSMVTAIMWGILPVFLSITLSAMDAITVTFYRFAVAALLVALILIFQKELPKLRQVGSKTLCLMLASAGGLIFNYVAYLKGLELVNPQTAQVVIQLAPFLLMVGGIAFFKERFTLIEMGGAVVLFAGLLLFFNERLIPLFTQPDAYSAGVLWIVVAAIAWAGYALVQKPIMRRMTAKQLTLLLYICGSLVLVPASDLGKVFNMNSLQGWSLLFCCLNTLIAYGSFTEAMQCWQAAKVSAVIALAPVFTFVSMYFAVIWWPEYFSSSGLNAWAYVGAGLVVIGSMLAALGRSR